MLELCYPFKIEGLWLVHQVLVCCLYDALIASILWTTKMGFQFWEQKEVRKSHIRRIWGMRKDFQIHIQSQQSWQLVTCGQRRCPARAEHLESGFLASFLRFPGVATSISLHNIHSLSCDIAKDNQPWSPLAIPNDWGHHPLKFLRRRRARVLPLFALHFDSGSTRCTHVSSWVTTHSIKPLGSSS